MLRSTITKPATQRSAPPQKPVKKSLQASANSPKPAQTKKKQASPSTAQATPSPLKKKIAKPQTPSPVVKKKSAPPAKPVPAEDGPSFEERVEAEVAALLKIPIHAAESRLRKLTADDEDFAAAVAATYKPLYNQKLAAAQQRIHGDRPKTIEDVLPPAGKVEPEGATKMPESMYASLGNRLASARGQIFGYAEELRDRHRQSAYEDVSEIVFRVHKALCKYENKLNELFSRLYPGSEWPKKHAITEDTQLPIGFKVTLQEKTSPNAKKHRAG